jgi:hypothetical protein
MNDQYYETRFHTSDMVDRSDEDTNVMVAKSYVAADKVLAYETPVQDEILVTEPVAKVSWMDETPVQDEVPMTEPVAEVTSMDEMTVHEALLDEAITQEIPVSTDAGSSAVLLNHEESEQFRTRWNEIQGKFVDEPRSAVQQADVLVSDVIGQISQMFAKQQSALNDQWNQGNEVSTEDLRKALQSYRSLFNRLVG